MILLKPKEVKWESMNIYTINQEVNYGGHLELSLDYDLYNINIAEYIEIRDKENNLLSLNFVK